MTQVALSSDHLFKKANREELRWSPNVAEVVRVRGVIVRHVQTDAKRLHVQVGGSCLGLTGKVQSCAEYRHVSNAARPTRGVRSVRNLLSVVS